MHGSKHIKLPVYKIKIAGKRAFKTKNIYRHIQHLDFVKEEKGIALYVGKGGIRVTLQYVGME